MAGRGRGRGRGWYSKCVNTEGLSGLSTPPSKPGGIPSSQPQKSASQNVKAEQKLYTPPKRTDAVPPTALSPPPSKTGIQSPQPQNVKQEQKVYIPPKRTDAVPPTALSPPPSKPGIQSSQTQNVKQEQKVYTTPKRTDAVPPTALSPPPSKPGIQSSQPQNVKQEQKVNTTPKRTEAAPTPVISPVPVPVSSSATADLARVLKDVDTLRKSQVLSEIPDAIFKVCNQHSSEKEQLMTEFTKIVCQKALKDPDFAMVGAQLCNALWISDKTGPALRTPLLTTVQLEYKKRTGLKRSQYYGLTVILCELYKLLRVQGQSLKPLNNPVCHLLKELISGDKITDDDAFYFFQEIERVGVVIEKDNFDNMEEIINLIREICISNEDILPSARCRFVQLIELRASRWMLPDTINTIYEDLNQELMAAGR